MLSFAGAVAAPKITIYTKANCEYCAHAKALFDDKKITYDEISVEGREDVRAWLVEQTGELTLPQIFAGDQWLGGFRKGGKLAGRRFNLTAAS